MLGRKPKNFTFRVFHCFSEFSNRRNNHHEDVRWNEGVCEAVSGIPFRPHLSLANRKKRQVCNFARASTHSFDAQVRIKKTLTGARVGIGGLTKIQWSADPGDSRKAHAFEVHEIS